MKNKNQNQIDESRVKKLFIQIRNRIITYYVIIGLLYSLLFCTSYARKELIWPFVLMFLLLFITELSHHTFSKVRECFLDRVYKEKYLTIGFDNPIAIFLAIPIFFAIVFLIKHEYVDVFIMFLLILFPLIFIYLDRLILYKKIDYATVSIKQQYQPRNTPCELYYRIISIRYLKFKDEDTNDILRYKFLKHIEEEIEQAEKSSAVSAESLLPDQYYDGFKILKILIHFESGFFY